jgi:hypothetical protein
MFGVLVRARDTCVRVMKCFFGDLLTKVFGTLIIHYNSYFMSIFLGLIVYIIE